jgi:hypothetical protein
MIYDRVKELAIKNKKLREADKLVCIPFNKVLPRFSTLIPGIIKERYIIVTANSKVGKSKLTDFLFLYTPYKVLYEQYKGKSNIKLKIFYFTLELSKEKKIAELLAYKLYEDKKLNLDIQRINSMFDDYILTDEVVGYMEEYNEWFKQFETIVEFIDDIRNPFGIYNHVRSYAESHGKYVKKTIKIDKKDVEVEDYYIPDDPDEHVIIITDHVGLLTPEAKDNNDVRTAIGRFSKEYCLKMRDRWKYTVVNVQQQTLAQEGVDNIKLNKLQPSAAGLGVNKETSQDANLILGLFSPARHDISSYKGIDITRLGDSYRELSVIYNRDGSMAEVGLFFNGAVNYFEELPKNIKDTDYPRYLKMLK